MGKQNDTGKKKNIFSIADMDFISSELEKSKHSVSKLDVDKQDLIEWMKKNISELKQIDINSIECNKTFSYYGLSSVDGMRFSGEIEEYLKITVPPNVTYQYSTINKLADYLLLGKFTSLSDNENIILTNTYDLCKQKDEDAKITSQAEIIEKVIQNALVISNEKNCIYVKYSKHMMTDKLDAFIKDNLKSIYELTGENGKIMPLSSSQKRYLVASILQAGKAAYNNPVAIHLEGNINFNKLKEAIYSVLNANSVLRTQFSILGDYFYQTIKSGMNAPIEYIDLSKESEVENKIFQLMKEEAEQGIDPLTDQLIRFRFIYINSNNGILITTVHHTLFDGFSFSPFINQILNMYYDDERDKVADNYEEYIIEEYIADYSEHQEFWKNRLAKNPPYTQLPLDRFRPEINSYHGDTIEIDILPDNFSGIKKLSSELESTVFSSLLSALYILISSWSKEKEIVFGTVIQNRDKKKYNNSLGDFTNLLPVKVSSNTSHKAKELLKEVNETIQACLEHKVYPYDKMIELGIVKQHQNINPLYNIHVNYLPKNDIVNFHDLKIFAQNNRKLSNSSMMDLRFEFCETDGKLMLSCEYNTDIFNKSTIQSLLDAYNNILHQMVSAKQELLLTDIVIPEFKITILEEPKAEVKHSNRNLVSAVSPVHNACGADNLNIVKEVFEQVTGNSELDGNFFEIGGSSVKAVQLVNLLKTKGIEISITDIFKYPTIRLLSEHFNQLEYPVKKVTESAAYEINKNKISVLPAKSNSENICNIAKKHSNLDYRYEKHFNLYVIRKHGRNVNEHNG